MAKSNTIKKQSKLEYDRFFIVPEALILKIGYEESLILSRIEYWLGVCGKSILNERGLWIYNSQNEWKKQFAFLSLYKIKKIIKSLEMKGLLISKKVNAKKCNHTKWYSIDFHKLNDLLTHSKSMNLIDKKISPKATNRLVEKEPIYNKQKTNYTNKASSKIKRVDVEKVITTVERKKDMEIIEIAKKMIFIWNEEFKYSLKPIKAYYNEAITKQLYFLYCEKFESDIENWNNYVLMVNSSKFLMGEKETKKDFKAVFQWLIKEEVVQTILEGGYGVGDRKLDRNNLSENIEKKKSEIVAMTNEKINEYIKSKISEENEKKKFKEYILTEEYHKDGDIYKIKDVLYNNSSLSPRNLVYEDRFRVIYNNFYNSYISQKYFGINSSDIKNNIKNLLDKTSENIDGYSTLDKLNSIDDKLKKINLNTTDFNTFIMQSEKGKNTDLSIDVNKM